MSTINELFTISAKKYANNYLLYEKQNESYIGLTYKQVEENVHYVACGLLSLGIKKGDRAALLSEGRNAWVISELGILFTGAINVPLSVKLNEAEEIKFRLVHSESRFLIVSGNQHSKIKNIKDQLPDLEKIIVINPKIPLEEKELSYDELIEEGKKYISKNKSEFEKNWKSVKNDDYANICYTSGTTADPKGIILTHRNYTANVEQARSLINVPEWYTTLLILPWDHSFAHTAGIYTLIKSGASMASIQVGNTPMETLKNIPVNIKETKPVFLLSVPALAKNFKKNIEKGIREKGRMVERLFNFAMNLARYYNGIGWNRGKGLKIMLKPLYNLFDSILFKKVREGFGGRMEFFIGGGALLDIELQDFFYAINMPMYQGYGLSEASPIISANSPEKHKLGSSGLIVDNLQIKICDEEGNSLPTGEKGEIVVQGENVMAGYWKNEKATNETIKNGWLHTGDLGYLDNDGFLYVLGRFKSLLIADDGEKYSPEGIEETLTEHSPILEQCMLYNNQDPYTVALIYPNKERIKANLINHSSELDDKEKAIEGLKMIENEINQYKKGGKKEDMFPNRWLPTAFLLLEEGFTEENRLLNSTLKMVRGKITERYQKEINYLFTPESKNIYNDMNISTMMKHLN